jgi:hypothetical protein
MNTSAFKVQQTLCLPPLFDLERRLAQVHLPLPISAFSAGHQATLCEKSGDQYAA